MAATRVAPLRPQRLEIHACPMAPRRAKPKKLEVLHQHREFNEVFCDSPRNETVDYSEGVRSGKKFFTKANLSQCAGNDIVRVTIIETGQSSGTDEL